MKKITLPIYTLVFFSFFFIFLTKVKAVTIQYPSYEVEININKDSSFEVTETIASKFYGEGHGVRRDVTLADPTQCTNSEFLTCGGFDRLIFLGIYDENDKKIDKAKMYEYEDDYGKKYDRFEWEIWPDGKDLSGDVVIWKVKYKVLGGIRWIGGNPYFYWNAFPEERSSALENAKLTINFPQNINLNPNELTLYDDSNPNIKYSSSQNKIVIERDSILPYSNYTVSYKFAETDLDQPGSLSYKIISPEIANQVFLNDDLVSDKNIDQIDYFPTGEQTLKFSHFGYEDYIVNLNIKPNEQKKLEISLTPTPLMSLLLILNWILFGFGIIMIPGAVFFVYRYYKKNGTDKNMPKTIIPLFTPPENTAPYLLGTIKDEKVDKEDIVGSIIDLAYRGYIKIKEITKDKNYQLTRLEGKDGDKGLNSIEQEIIDALFRTDEVIETKNLALHFPPKYQSIVSHVYKEVVDKKYFERSPQTVRSSFFGLGFVIFIFSLFLTVFASMIISVVLGFITPFSLGIGLMILGAGFIAAANFMPAKTELGSKIYADILGFKMYLHTAERFRLQNLGPEEFEKYLSYAIVFKIEKEWAEKFKDIYKQVPDWYEGTGNVYDAIWISSFARGFSNSTVSNLTPVSSSKGGGWSGSGGSFGGFSGGGGGGGGVGGW